MPFVNPLLRWESKERGGDKHIRRDGDAYTVAFLQLLPQGQAWPRRVDCTNDETTLYRVCRGLAYYWGHVDSRAADLLEQESDPSKAVELLPDWERAWGLPDDCFPEATTIGERQKMLILKMTWIGGQSREYFTNLMAWLGFDVHIREYSPWMAGVSRCGDTRETARIRYEWCPDELGPFVGKTQTIIPRCVPSGWLPVEGDDIPDGVPEDNFRWYIGPPEMRFAWSANSDKMGLVWFRSGQSEAGVDPHLQLRPPQDLQCLLNRWKPAHTQIVMNTGNQLYTDPMAGTP